MSNIPVLTEEDIRDFVNEGNYQRGLGYFRQDRVFDPRRYDLTLTAKCEGSHDETYRVNVVFNEQGVIVSAMCSCPLKICCKHVVALLQTWVLSPTRFIETASPDIILAGFSREELIDILKQMIEKDPDLEDTVLTMSSHDNVAINMQLYQRKVEYVFRNLASDWDAGRRAAEGLFGIMQNAELFVKKHDYATALTIYQVLLTNYFEHYKFSFLRTEDYDSVLATCLKNLVAWWPHVAANSPERTRLLYIFWLIEGFHLTNGEHVLDYFVESATLPRVYLLHHATSAERRTIADWVRADIVLQENQPVEESDIYAYAILRRPWYASFIENEVPTKLSARTSETVDVLERFVLLLFAFEAFYARQSSVESPDEMQSFADDEVVAWLSDDDYLSICCTYTLVYPAISRLLQRRRAEEALTYISSASIAMLPRMAELFSQYEQVDAVRPYLQEVAWRTRNEDILRWLRENASDQLVARSHMKTAMAQYRNVPSLDIYRRIRPLAALLGDWLKVRAELFKILSNHQLFLLQFEIALEENDSDLLVDVVHMTDMKRYSEEFQRPVNEALKRAEDTHPSVIANYYLKSAEKNITVGNRTYYEQACAYLLDVRALYRKRGMQATWQSYITQCRTHYNRKLMFLELLDKYSL
ncbi:hypothetical protein ccbrp13_34760 [Ktedonobacteria bacterium brp13]|nr:hypothetical protein ccbrp13_34760 [Ktedonobacteria bacterium brp13]